jgi:hypothetical protein
MTTPTDLEYIFKKTQECESRIEMLQKNLHPKKYILSPEMESLRVQILYKHEQLKSQIDFLKRVNTKNQGGMLKICNTVRLIRESIKGLNLDMDESEKTIKSLGGEKPKTESKRKGPFGLLGDDLYVENIKPEQLSEKRKKMLEVKKKLESRKVMVTNFTDLKVGKKLQGSFMESFNDSFDTEELKSSIFHLISNAEVKPVHNEEVNAPVPNVSGFNFATSGFGKSDSPTIKTEIKGFVYNPVANETKETTNVAGFKPAAKTGGACMVNNKDGAAKCKSCETPAPNAKQAVDLKEGSKIVAPAPPATEFNFANSGFGATKTAKPEFKGFSLVAADKEANTTEIKEVSTKITGPVPQNTGFSFANAAFPTSDASKTTTGFSFVAAAKKEESNPQAPITRGFSFAKSNAFAPTFPAWKCDLCTVQNKIGVSVCASCENPCPALELKPASSVFSTPSQILIPSAVSSTKPDKKIVTSAFSTPSKIPTSTGFSFLSAANKDNEGGVKVTKEKEVVLFQDEDRGNVEESDEEAEGRNSSEDAYHTGEEEESVSDNENSRGDQNEDDEGNETPDQNSSRNSPESTGSFVKVAAHEDPMDSNALGGFGFDTKQKNKINPMFGMSVDSIPPLNSKETSAFNSSTAFGRETPFGSTTGPAPSVSSSVFGSSNTSSTPLITRETSIGSTDVPPPSVSSAFDSSVFGQTTAPASSVKSIAFGSTTGSTSPLASSVFGSTTNPAPSLSSVIVSDVPVISIASAPNIFSESKPGAGLNMGGVKKSVLMHETIVEVNSAYNTPRESVFGKLESNSNTSFGSSMFEKKTSAFGSTGTANSEFGSIGFGNNATTPSALGSSANSNNTSAFGNNATTPSAFGSSANSITTPAFGSSGFGNKATTPSAFGSSANSNTTPAFGSSGFGNNASTPSAFGSSANSNATPAFGSSGFGNNATTPSAFGSSANSNTTPAFGSSGFGNNATTPSAFGSSANSNTTPAFGNNATTPSAFGSSANSNTTPAFGSSGFGNNATTPSAFGSSANLNTTPAFGSSGFGNNATTPSAFGSSANSNTTPAFGTSGFGNNATTPSAFGSSANSNTTPAFGSSGFSVSSSGIPAFGSSGFAAPATSAAPSFGSSTAFSGFASQAQGYCSIN